MRFSLYSKKNQLDEMQEQTLRKIEGRPAGRNGNSAADGQCR